MMHILYIIGGIFLVALVMILFACFIFTIQYIWMYHCHRCKHCGHFMEFRGLKEDKDEGHFLFHCRECGAWEEIPKEEFLRHYEQEYNPNETWQ